VDHGPAPTPLRRIGVPLLGVDADTGGTEPPRQPAGVERLVSTLCSRCAVRGCPLSATIPTPWPVRRDGCAPHPGGHGHRGRLSIVAGRTAERRGPRHHGAVPDARRGVASARGPAMGTVALRPSTPTERTPPANPPEGEHDRCHACGRRGVCVFTPAGRGVGTGDARRRRVFAVRGGARTDEGGARRGQPMSRFDERLAAAPAAHRAREAGRGDSPSGGAAEPPRHARPALPEVRATSNGPHADRRSGAPPRGSVTSQSRTKGMKDE